MAAETLRPDGQLSCSSLVTCDFLEHDEDPDVSSVTINAIDNNRNTEYGVDFPTPSGNPTVGADLQEFRAGIEEFDSGQTGTPQARIELWESGALVRAGTNVNVSVYTVLSFTWNANELTTADGSLVQCKVIGSKSGGSPSARNTVRIGHIEWNAEVDAGGPVTGDGSSAGTSTVTGDGVSTAAADGSSAGAATATGDGASTFAADGVSTGSATASAAPAVSGSSGGVATVTGDGASTFRADGSSAGVATATGDGVSTFAAPGSSTGAATTTGDGVSTAAGDGSAAGVATAEAVGQEAGNVVTGDGSSAGTATVTGDGVSTAAADGSSIGVATTTGDGVSTFAGDGSSTGAATATGDGGSTNSQPGASAGLATVTGDGVSTSSQPGSAAGVATVEAVGQEAGVTVTGGGSSAGAAAVTGGGGYKKVFDISNLALHSHAGGAGIYTYITPEDNLATTAMLGYFGRDLTTGQQSSDMLRKNDIIMINATDGSVILRVDTVDGLTVETVQFT